MTRPTLHGLIRAGLLVLAACAGDSPVGAPPPPPPPPPATPVATMEISPATLNVVVGRTGTLTAVARDARGRELAGRSTTWASSAEAVATVSGAGVVTAVSLGTATIVATAEGQTAQAAVTVIPVPVGSVTIVPETVSIKLADTKPFAAVVKNDLATVLTDRIVRRSRSSNLVAKVDRASGIVSGEDDRTATIRIASHRLPFLEVARARRAAGPSPRPHHALAVVSGPMNSNPTRSTEPKSLRTRNIRQVIRPS